MNALQAWARKWNLPDAALAELGAAMHAAPPPPRLKKQPACEADIVALCKLWASRAGWRIWRNNVGAVQDENGNFFRYGLANESKKQNKLVKSSDLIGIRPVKISFAHVGRTLGQFVAVECKGPGWKWQGTEREEAQKRFLTVVMSKGGHAVFSNNGGVE